MSPLVRYYFRQEWLTVFTPIRLFALLVACMAIFVSGISWVLLAITCITLLVSDRPGSSNMEFAFSLPVSRHGIAVARWKAHCLIWLLAWVPLTIVATTVVAIVGPDGKTIYFLVGMTNLAAGVIGITNQEKDCLRNIVRTTLSFKKCSGNNALLCYFIYFIFWPEYGAGCNSVNSYFRP